MVGTALLSWFPEKKPRYLLCRPQGGFNDTLCQIEKCWRYAAKYRRTLLVDTTRSGLLDDFSNYFAPRKERAHIKLTLDADMLAALNAMDTRPDAIAGRIDSYDVDWCPDIANFLDKETRQQLAFDRERNHPETLLVHHQCGGGRKSVNCLARLKLTRSVAEEVERRLANLESPYLALHVRYTDMQTAYEDYFESISEDVKGKTLLVCSDNVACVDHAKRYFTESDIVTVSSIPDTGGRPLHYNSALDRYATNVDALVDLLAMAGSKTVLFAKTARGTKSGFSGLARHLNRRPNIVRHLLAP